MTHPLKRADSTHDYAIRSAIRHLREARDCLAYADCPNALEKVRAALKSAEGAERHMSTRLLRTREAECAR